MRAATATLGYPGYIGYTAIVRGEARARGREANGVKTVALAIAGPFVGLAFVLALPFVGLAALAWAAARALRENHSAVARYAWNVLLFLGAPFVGLAYALAFPFVGIGALAWVALRREPAAG